MTPRALCANLNGMAMQNLLYPSINSKELEAQSLKLALSTFSQYSTSDYHKDSFNPLNLYKSLIYYESVPEMIINESDREKSARIK